MTPKISLFLAEFRRRKVGRVAVAYVLVGFGAIEAADIIGGRLLFPAWAIQFFIVLVLLGFPIALILAWALEVGPGGLQRTPKALCNCCTAAASRPLAEASRAR